MAIVDFRRFSLEELIFNYIKVASDEGIEISYKIFMNVISAVPRKLEYLFLFTLQINIIELFLSCYSRVHWAIICIALHRTVFNSN